MKSLLILLCLLTGSLLSIAQDCKEVIFTDTTEIAQIIQFKVDCRNARYLQNGMGVFTLYRYYQAGEKYFLLRYYIDDTCLDKHPTQFAYINGGIIVLIHEADSTGKPIMEPFRQETQDCIQKIVEGWLYIHPRKDQWYINRFDGQTVRINKSKEIRSVDGWSSPGVIIRFKKDGSIEKKAVLGN